MLKELYTAAIGMMPQQTRLEVISNNLANANTIGFKRSAVFERNLMDARANLFNVPSNAEQEDVPVGSYIDFSTGAYHQTGNPLDIAIEDSNSFFIVEDDLGNQYFTRAGNFTIGEGGNIQSSDGKKLIGTNGQINVLKQHFVDQFNATDKTSMEIRINEQGNVFVNEEEIDTIALAQINDLNKLQNISNSDFIAINEANIEMTSHDLVKIRQGWIEESNVNLISEMVEMIQLQRQFETGSKVITTNNDTLDYSIQIGRFF